MFDVVLVFLTAFELYSNFVALKTWVLFFATDCIATFSINCVTIIQICLTEEIQTWILHAHDVSGHVQMISAAVGHTRPHCQVSVVMSVIGIWSNIHSFPNPTFPSQSPGRVFSIRLDVTDMHVRLRTRAQWLTPRP